LPKDFTPGVLVNVDESDRSIIIDYIPYKRHPGARRLFEWLLRLATLVVGVGFYEFETNDVGITEGVRRIWKAGSTDKAVGPA
jgi:succinate dehydrogenase (ubiquinone) membrane anchor subunit